MKRTVCVLIAVALAVMQAPSAAAAEVSPQTFEKRLYAAAKAWTSTLKGKDSFITMRTYEENGQKSWSEIRGSFNGFTGATTARGRPVKGTNSISAKWLDLGETVPKSLLCVFQTTERNDTACYLSVDNFLWREVKRVVPVQGPYMTSPMMKSNGSSLPGVVSGFDSQATYLTGRSELGKFLNFWYPGTQVQTPDGMTESDGASVFVKPRTWTSIAAMYNDDGTVDKYQKIVVAKTKKPQRVTLPTFNIGDPDTTTEVYIDPLYGIVSLQTVAPE